MKITPGGNGDRTVAFLSCSTMRKVYDRRHLRALIDLCVAGGMTIVVLGGVEAYGDKPVSKGDAAVPEAELTGATTAPLTDEPRGSGESPGGIGIDPDTERQLSAPDDDLEPIHEDRDMTRELEVLSSFVMHEH